MNSQAFGLADIGLKRKNNEDSFLINDHLGLYVVCEGIGGAAVGEIASWSAVNAIAKYLREHRGELTDGLPDDVKDQAEDVVEEVRELSRTSAKRTNLRTTLSLLIVQNGVGNIAYVGDSRIYLIRGTKIARLTTDHTMAIEVVESGLWTRKQADQSNLRNVLTRSLNREGVAKVETRAIRLRSGDRQTGRALRVVCGR